MPNCPVPNCPGAKLSWCQIVHFYYLGAKLSAFIILVPNCPLYYLGAKLSGVKLSGAKLSYNELATLARILGYFDIFYFGLICFEFLHRMQLPGNLKPCEGC